MSDKPIAGIVTAAAVAPICILCVLGPVALGSVTTWLSGWLGGLGPVVSTGLAIVVGLLVLGIVRRRRERAATPGGPSAEESTSGSTQPRERRARARPSGAPSALDRT